MMTKNRRTFVAVVACLMTISSTAFAGKPSSGSKRDPQIRVENDQQYLLGVLFNPSDAHLDAALAALEAESIEDFKNKAGGYVINADGYKEFKAKVGNNVVYLVNLSTGNYDGAGYSLKKGDVKVVRASEFFSSATLN